MKPIALQMYSLREMAKADFFGALKAVADIGYAGVEFAGLFNFKPAEVAKVLADLGLKVASSHVPMPTPGDLNQAIDTAKTLGYEHCVISYLPPARFVSVDETRRVAAVLQATAELIKPHGLKLGYHNHSHEMVELNGQHVLDLLLSSAGDLQAEIDMYWTTNFGKVNAPAFIKKWAKRTPLLHVKDGPMVQGQPHVAVGSGKMDIAGCVAAADESVLKWVIVELDQCATDMLTAVKQSYEFMTSRGLAKGTK